jgi:hypothetical protein
MAKHLARISDATVIAEFNEQLNPEIFSPNTPCAGLYCAVHSHPVVIRPGYSKPPLAPWGFGEWASCTA